MLVTRLLLSQAPPTLVLHGYRHRAVLVPPVSYVASSLRDRLERWTGTGYVFAAYRIDEQIAKALDRKVWLPSGGSLVIDRTEAMTVVDVATHCCGSWTASANATSACPARPPARTSSASSSTW